MRFCILSISQIPDDPRVRRQGDALHEAGHAVHAVGLPGGRCEAPAWDVTVVDEPASTLVRRLGTAWRGLVGRLGERAALWAYWRSALHRSMYEAAREHPADLVIANDWRVLPIAQRLAKDWNARVHYDSHEYAIEERADSRAWRLLIAPFVRQIEGACIRDVATVSTVADGIADAMQAIYRLPTRPTVIRNTPEYVTMPLQSVRRPIRVLFQGGLLPDRGLEDLIESVSAWTVDAVLTIRGPAEPRYRQSLERLISATESSDRIRLLEPAPMTDLVMLANEHDVGVFTPSAVTEQMRFALPNKLFEYLMGGLCVISSDLPEIRRILVECNAGAVIQHPSPRSIAHAINGLDEASVLAAKSNALEAAKELCWEKERSRLLGLLTLPGARTL